MMRSVHCRLLAAAIFTLLVTGVQAQTRIEKKFDAWMVACQEAETKSCALSQTLSDAKTQRTVLALVVAKGLEGRTRAVVRTPTGVLLPEGLTLTANGIDPVKAIFRFCGPRACTADFQLDDAWLGILREQAEITVGFKSMAGEPFNIKVSLKGFAAAYDYFVEQTS
jgi:invasion protein IalB